MSRFFVDSSDVFDNVVVISDKGDVHHIKDVLRLKKGAAIEVSDSEEWEYEAEIVSLDKDEVQARITDKQRFAREPSLRVTLFQGVPKSGKADLIIQKATELGVSKMVPVFTARCIAKEGKGFEKKSERLNKIALEASKQCRRGIPAEVADAVDLEGAVALFTDYDLVLFPYENEEEQTMKDALRDLPYEPKTVAVIIGPEGGFSDSEADLIKRAGGLPVSLGKTILRTETAGIAAISMIMYELEM